MSLDAAPVKRSKQGSKQKQAAPLLQERGHQSPRHLGSQSQERKYNPQESLQGIKAK